MGSVHHRSHLAADLIPSLLLQSALYKRHVFSISFKLVFEKCVATRNIYMFQVNLTELHSMCGRLLKY